MKQPINYAGAYPNNWAGYVFKEALGYTSGVHTGVDYNGAGGGNADLGMPIGAIVAGTVVARVNNGQVGGFGNALIIQTDACPPNTAGNKLFHRYLHMNSVNVNVGQTVTEGQQIGTVGNTGTEYAHLHLDVWTDRNGLGAHWNYDKDTELASYEDAFWIIEHNKGWTGVDTLLPYQRVVGSAGVNYREQPNTGAGIIRDFQPGEVLDFKGFVRGENVSGNDIWYQGRYTGGYSWSGSFTDSGTSGLPDLTPQPPVVDPPQPPDTSKYVIDVSAHNTITDYATVISNVRGAIAKAGHTGKSYGGTALNGDPKFADYKANFGAKLSGAYWYAYCSLNPVIEAKHFIEAVGQVPDNFTYWLDIEEADDQTKERINTWCVAFLTEVDNLTKRVCGIYMNRNWHDNYITAATKGNRPIWLAHYDTGEFSNPVQNQVAHQFTSSGKVAGYDGNLDLNVVREEFFKPTAITPPEPPKPEELPTTPPEPEKPVTPPAGGSQTLLDVVLGWLKSLANWLSQWVRK